MPFGDPRHPLDTSRWGRVLTLQPTGAPGAALYSNPAAHALATPAGTLLPPAVLSTPPSWFTWSAEMPDLPRKEVTSPIPLRDLGRPEAIAEFNRSFEPGMASATWLNWSPGIFALARPSIEPAPRMACACERPGMAELIEPRSGPAALATPAADSGTDLPPQLVLKRAPQARTNRDRTTRVLADMVPSFPPQRRTVRGTPTAPRHRPRRGVTPSSPGRLGLRGLRRRADGRRRHLVLRLPRLIQRLV